MNTFTLYPSTVHVHAFCIFSVERNEMIHVNPIQYLKKLQIFIMAYAIMHIANCTNTKIFSLNEILITYCISCII